jgi:hypothetical protein
MAMASFWGIEMWEVVLSCLSLFIDNRNYWKTIDLAVGIGKILVVNLTLTMAPDLLGKTRVATTLVRRINSELDVLSQEDDDGVDDDGRI